MSVFLREPGRASQVCMLGIVVDNQRQADLRRLVVQDVAGCPGFALRISGALLSS